MIIPFVPGEMVGFADHLNSEFRAEDAADAAILAELAAGNLALHGTGCVSGLVLSPGSGLSANLSDGAYLLGGRYYLQGTQIGYEVIALPANQTSYIYMDAAGSFVCCAAQQTPDPTGTWYVGSATTGASVCLSVSQVGCDRVLNPAGLQGELTAIADEVSALDSAIGIPYTGSVSLQARVTTLEGGGDGGSQVVYWGALQKANGDPTTVDQEIASKIAALPSAGGSGSGVAVSKQWDVDAVNQSKHLLRYTGATDHQGPANAVDCVTIVWGCYGDGSNSSPDFVDRVHSTWLPS